MNRWRSSAVVALLGIGGCMTQGGALDRPSGQTPPPLVIGDFVDDYGIAYRISGQEWHQLPNTRYRVVGWHPEAQYLIAQNVASNASDAGLWTRIDWIALPGMPPYEWAFCLSAYDAPTLADAERTTLARRDEPKTGCNGFPFSRMHRARDGED